MLAKHANHWGYYATLKYAIYQCLLIRHWFYPRWFAGFTVEIIPGAGTHVPNSPVNWNLKHYSRGRLTWFLSQILTTRPPNDDKFGKNNGIPRTQTPSRTHTVNACIWVAKEAIFSLFLLNLSCITPTFPRLLARTRITSIQSHCKVVTVTWKWQLIHRDKNSDI